MLKPPAIAALPIRAARPEDGPALVPLIYSAGPDAFDYVFLNRALGFLTQSFGGTRGAFSHLMHWTALYQGRPAACVSLYTRAQHDARNPGTIAEIFRWAGLKAPAVLMRGLKVESLIKPPPPGSLHIAHLAVRPDLRGAGLGAQLLDFAGQRARDLGLDRISLDVSAGNPRAQSLYERAGFAVQRQHASRIDGLCDHRFMVRGLC